MHRIPRLLPFVLILLAGCAGPAPGPEGPAGAALPEAARIGLKASAAREPAYMSQHVTPIQVEIANTSGEPLRVAYAQFALVDAEGRYHAALPLFALGGPPAEPHLGQRRVPVAAPGFRAAQFSVAPAYADLYPGLEAFAGPFAFDAQYHGHYFAQWASIPLPTEEMLRLGLPEGVLGPGGTLSGLVYFEHAAQAGREVRLRVDFVNAFTGRRFGTRSVAVGLG